MGKLNTLALTTSFFKAGAITSLLLSSHPRIVELRTRIPLYNTIKVILVFFAALNLTNFPLRWHLGILGPWFNAILKGKFASITGGPKGHGRLMTRHSPVGKSPFDPNVCEVLKLRAEIADCDYNGHLSNSAYAKNLDQVRINACITYFSGFGATGGMMLLGGGYFHFVKEIPLLAEYEIRFYISGWDEKWIYLTGAFITYPKKGSKKSRPTANGNGNGHTSSNGHANGHALDVSTAAISLSSLNGSAASNGTSLTIPASTATSAAPSGMNTPITSDPLLSSKSHSIYSEISSVPLPEGAQLHAISISQYCFKQGRISVPPRVALILAGFGKFRNSLPPHLQEKSNPPAWDARKRWDAILPLRYEKGGKVLRDIMRGGWKREDGGDARLGEGFWEFEEFESEGRRKGAAIGVVKGVMGALGSSSLPTPGSNVTVEKFAGQGK